jgi:hypothetical protein
LGEKVLLISKKRTKSDTLAPHTNLAMALSISTSRLCKVGVGACQVLKNTLLYIKQLIIKKIE